MKKFFYTLGLLFLLSPLSIMAQQGNAQVTQQIQGLWQRYIALSGTLNASEIIKPLPLFKILQPDGTFMNISVNKSGMAFYSTVGEYKVLSNREYTERIKENIFDSSLINTESTLHYTLKDANLMLIDYVLPNGYKDSEIWVRVVTNNADPSILIPKLEDPMP